MYLDFIMMVGLNHFMDTIRMPHGHYVFLLMSFGLTNSQATFIDLINRVFKHYLDMFVIDFIGDIVICLRNEKDRASYLKIVL